MDGGMIPTDILIPAWVDGTLTPVEKLAAHQRGLRHLRRVFGRTPAARILLGTKTQCNARTAA